VNFKVEFSKGVTRPEVVFSDAPQFEGTTLVINGDRYTEEQWVKVTVYSDKGQPDKPAGKSNAGLVRISMGRDLE
jgi:hypothetical protein